MYFIFFLKTMIHSAVELYRGVFKSIMLSLGAVIFFPVYTQLNDEGGGARKQGGVRGKRTGREEVRGKC